MSDRSPNERQRALLLALAERAHVEDELRAIVGGARPARTTASLLRHGWARRERTGEFAITARGWASLASTGTLADEPREVPC